MTRQLILATAITLQIRISLRILSLSAALREKTSSPTAVFRLKQSLLPWPIHILQYLDWGWFDPCLEGGEDHASPFQSTYCNMWIMPYFTGDVCAYDELETAYSIANAKPVIRQGGLGL